jgi:hypothetical protein
MADKRSWLVASGCFAGLVVSSFLICSHAQSQQAGGTQFPAPLSSTLPFDVNEAKVHDLVHKNDLLSAHREFDTLAWQAFIALNWPADENGKPSKTLPLSNTEAPRVWEFWRPANTIFLEEGSAPKPWSNTVQKNANYFWKAAWRQHTTQASNLEAFSGPLIDQNGKWVRYQMRVNKEEFDYIVKNELYSQDGQAKFSHQEADNQVDLPVNDGSTSHGAIEIKLAWKELGSNDDPSRFLTREIDSELSEPTKDGKLPTRKFKAGLVGMHISMRTKSSPEWIWATFEQVDNVRQNKDVHGHLTHANFTDPNNKTAKVNKLPETNATTDPTSGGLVPAKGVQADKWIESLTKTPIQLARIQIPTQLGLNPLDEKLSEVTKALNAQVQALLQKDGSVLQNYELIDAQWPVHPNALAFVGGKGSAPMSITHKTPGDIIPVFLVNTTMESYFQVGKQAASSLEQDDRLESGVIDSTSVIGSESCVGCHYSSGITQGFKIDMETGREVVDKNGYPTAVYGENNHFGKTGGANFSWMLQLEPKARKRDIHSANVIVKEQ